MTKAASPFQRQPPAEGRRPAAVCIAWKDIRNPAAGGAELMIHEISKRWVQAGWSVTHLVPGFPGAGPVEIVDGVRIERVGQSVLAFPRLARRYRCRHRAETDVLIDVFNCVGSLSALRRGPALRAILVFHVQGRMWFHQTVFPGVPRALMPPLGVAGFLVEKAQLLALSWCFRGPVLTISASTRTELTRHRFPPELIRIVRPGIAVMPLAALEESAPKEPVFTVLLIGPRRSKRPMDTLRAFARLQEAHPETALWIAGWGTEDERLAGWAKRRGLASVRVWGRVDEKRKRDLMQRAHVLCTSPVKEGWGLAVTEANAMGTPAVGYDVPGLRESLSAGGGRVCAPHPDALSAELAAVYRLWRDSPPAYEQMRRAALESARAMTFDHTFRDFTLALGLVPTTASSSSPRR